MKVELIAVLHEITDTVASLVISEYS